MHRGRKSAVAIVEAPPRAERARMSPEDFASVASRITRVVTFHKGDRPLNGAAVMAAAAANAFNAEVASSKRLLLLAQGQLSIFGVVREEVASELRRLASQRDAAYSALVAEHYPLLS